MRALLSFLLSVGGIVISFVAIALWLRSRPESARGRRVLLLVAVAYTLLTIYSVNYAIGRLLFLEYEPLASAPPGVTAIVVLASGSFTTRDWSDREYSIVDPVAASRVLEAARVYRMVDTGWIISSGGKLRPDDPHQASGITMRDALVDLGVPASRILVEAISQNTHEEAVAVAPMLRDLKVDQVVLVTSGEHMRRSLGTFRAEGIRALPAVARDPYASYDWDHWLIPSAHGLGKGASVAHELMGIVYYGLRGWYSF